MHRYVLPIATLLMGTAFGSVGAAGLAGIWDTEGGKAQVQISPCGQVLCGATVWLAEPLTEEGAPKRDTNNPEEGLRGREIVGLRILWDMQPASDGRSARNGRIYDPESGKTYHSRMQLQGDDELRVRGYVGTPMLGRSVTWTRAERLNEPLSTAE
jgi:uncharacterized protein (DUF2147 family)